MMASELTSAQAAEILGVTPARVGQFAAEGRIKILRTIGSSNLYCARSVAKFAKSPRKAGRPKGSRNVANAQS